MPRESILLQERSTPTGLVYQMSAVQMAQISDHPQFILEMTARAYGYEGQVYNFSFIRDSIDADRPELKWMWDEMAECALQGLIRCFHP